MRGLSLSIVFKDILHSAFISFSKFISRVQVHDLQDILEVDRNKLEVGMGSVGMGTGKCGV